ncbi:MAG TPA: ABC transporter ATP-binding protein [Streptosporangiaceae bacterium]|nr:ABC transporter ATP-binding protein [Streptosporangiaceae bacterium]
MEGVSAGQLPAIVVERLCKDYGRLRAVDGVSFEVRRGEIYALLGPNGAGKTTTVEILEGHRKRTSGSVRVLGLDPGAGGRRFRERIGIVLQSGGIDAEVTVREIVTLYASFYARPREVAETIEQVGLTSKRRARVRTLSGGQLRRLDLALALIGDPDLLFLDEPTTGFDPNARRDAWETIAGLRRSGTTVLLTSHYLDEVQQLADRVGVMSHGHLVEESTPDALGGRDIAGTVISFRLPAKMAGEKLPTGPWDEPEHLDGEIVMRTDQPTRVLLALTRWAVGRGVELEGLSVVRPSLEDAYLQITGDASAGGRRDR